MKDPKRWGRLDSNQRSPKTRDLQSLAIAAMRHPPKRQMLAKGVEPSTVRLQGGCSAIELHQQKRSGSTLSRSELKNLDLGRCDKIQPREFSQRLKSQFFSSLRHTKQVTQVRVRL